MSERILVTGGSGFIGTNLIETIRPSCSDILNIDINSPKDSEQAKFYEKCDIRDETTLMQVVADFQPQKIFHLAARTDLGGADVGAYDTNVLGVENVIKAIQASDSVKFTLFCSTMLVCNLKHSPENWEDYTPDTYYGESKVLGEKIVRKNLSLRKNWCIARPTSVWGPWFDEPYSNFFKMIKKGHYVHPRGVQILRNYSYVENIVYQMRALSDINFSNSTLDRTFYLCDYKPTEIGAWADQIANHIGKNPPLRLPLPIFKILANLGDLLKFAGWHSVPLTSFRLRNMLTPRTFDTTVVERLVGDLPFSLKHGITNTIEWIEKYG